MYTFGNGRNERGEFLKCVSEFVVVIVECSRRRHDRSRRREKLSCIDRLSIILRFVSLTRVTTTFNRISSVFGVLSCPAVYLCCLDVCRSSGSARRRNEEKEKTHTHYMLSNLSLSFSPLSSQPCAPVRCLLLFFIASTLTLIEQILFRSHFISAKRKMRQKNRNRASSVAFLSIYSEWVVNAHICVCTDA